MGSWKMGGWHKADSPPLSALSLHSGLQLQAAFTSFCSVALAHPGLSPLPLQPEVQQLLVANRCLIGLCLVSLSPLICLSFF